MSNFTEEEKTADAVAGLGASFVIAVIAALIPWAFDLVTRKQSLGVALIAFVILLHLHARDHAKKYGEDHE